MKTHEPCLDRHPCHARARPTALYVAVLASVLAGGVHAAEIKYQLELVMLNSDNLNLSEDNQVAETVVIPRLRFEVKEQGSAVTLQARGELERRRYLGNEFPDETRSEFAGQLNWALLPERINLVLEDYLSVQPISLVEGRYPGNLQQVNVFLGGPTFFARLGNANRFQLDLRAADSQAEVTRGFDSKRYSAAAILQREITSTARASLNLVSAKAEFDDQSTAIDYTRHDGFIQFEGALADGEYEIDLGQSRLDRTTGSDASTPVVRARVVWNISPRSRLRLRARHQFADAVQDLVVRLRDPNEAPIPELAEFSAVTSGVYRERYYDVDYRFTGDSIGIRVRPLSRRLRYVDSPGNDRSERGAYLQADYRLRPRMKVFFQGFARERDFLSRPQHDEDRVYGLGVDYQLTRHWSWRAEANRNTRESNIEDARYKENVVQFTVVWKR